MERNTGMERVAEIFVGEWTITITDMWWLDDPTTVASGTARCEWIGDSFMRMTAELSGVPTWDFVFGRSDANDRFVVLYGDERAVQRVFDLSIDGKSWVMSRADPDFHQKILARIEGHRMIGEADASDDGGGTWRKDFDLIWERVG